MQTSDALDECGRPAGLVAAQRPGNNTEEEMNPWAALSTGNEKDSSEELE